MATELPPAVPKTPGERQAILEREIVGRVSKGYRLVTRTDTTAQMVEPKKFSFGFFLLWTLLTGVGLILYPAYYLAKKEEQRYLSVNEAGELIILDQGGRTMRSILAVTRR